MRRIAIYFLALLLYILAVPSFAQVSKFQALYLLNFSKNLDWNQENVTIGIVGNTKALIELETLVSKYPNISIKKISGSESITDCQMVFLPSAQSRNFSAIQGKIGSAPIVLVAEDNDLATKGAEIAFYLEGNKLRFTINKTAFDESGVRVTQKLLSVATVID